MSIQPFTLSSGTKIPGIAYGLGTKWWNPGGPKNPQAAKSLDLAIKLGFTHIDAAEAYGTYAELKDSLEKTDRSKLFITDKFNGHEEAEGHTPYPTLKASLQLLGIDYVDLYLLHSPFCYLDGKGQSLKDAWAEMVKLKEDGLAKDIGVSNFRIDDLKQLSPVPVVNEIEFSPYLQNQSPGIVEYCQKNDILVSAYSSLAPVTKGGPLTEYLDTLAKKYNRTPGEISLKWVLQKGVQPVTTSGSEDRMKGYLTIGGFSLTDEEVKKIDEIGSGHQVRQYWDGFY